ncbi:MAG: hypothetical protein RL328_1142 [Acidobacteriota bacterium]
MDLLFYRYRHLTVLLVAIIAQLGLLAFQVRNNQDVRLIRVWSVSAVTPLARVLESARTGSSSFIDDYFLLVDVRQENKKLKSDLETTLLENQRMRAELETAQRAEALSLFQKETPMKTVPARIFMNSTGSSSNVFVDVGTSQGVQPGMAVITPLGIVGKITAVYPTASMVLLANDPLFAAGVVSQTHRVQGTLKGQGGNAPVVDFVQNEQAVDPGEWFFTSGNDFIFPRGLRVGTVTAVKNGTRRKDIQLRLSGLDQALEHVLVIIQGVHTAIPDAPVEAPVSLLAPPVDGAAAPAGQPSQAAQTGPLATDADVIVDKLRRSGAVRSAAPDPAPQTSPAVVP